MRYIGTIKIKKYIEVGINADSCEEALTALKKYALDMDWDVCDEEYDECIVDEEILSESEKDFGEREWKLLGPEKIDAEEYL